MPKIFLKFVFTGGSAAVINVVLCKILVLFVIYEISVGVSYIIAMIYAYAVSKYFVFEQSQLPQTKEFGRFVIVNIISALIVWTVSVSLYRIIFPFFTFEWYPDTVAHIIGVCSPVYISFILHRNYSFQKSTERNSEMRN